MLRRRTLHLSAAAPQRACAVADPGAPYWRWRKRPAGCAHMHFISLPNPYSGVWIASAAQLRDFLASPYWGQEGAMPAHIEHAYYQTVGGNRRRKPRGSASVSAAQDASAALSSSRYMNAVKEPVFKGQMKCLSTIFKATRRKRRPRQVRVVLQVHERGERACSYLQRLLSRMTFHEQIQNVQNDLK